MRPGTAQGIAIHAEYKGATACLVELDCRPRTRNRDIPDGVGGPRVTRVTFAVDVGLPINPRGLEAQMQGGINDGIAQALTSSMHLRDGHFLEGSWDNYFYTRQWNTPPEVEVFVMPETTGEPGGAGEAGVAATMAAVACAYARATGKVADVLPDQPPRPAAVQGQAVRPAHPAVAGQRPEEDVLSMPKQTFIVNGKPVTVNVHPDVRVLWVLRDLLGITGPEVRLRHQRVQGVHVAHQRQGLQPVLGPRR